MVEQSQGLSEAIVVYLKNYPGKNDEEFQAMFGSDEAHDAVRKILDETMRAPMDLDGKSLIEIGQELRAIMHERHPDLTDAALKALGSYFTYLVK